MRPTYAFLRIASSFKTETHSLSRVYGLLLAAPIVVFITAFAALLLLSPNLKWVTEFPAVSLFGSARGC
jgi:hypothetical protein